MDVSLFFSLLLLGLLGCASCETCPPEEDISPCKCTLPKNKEDIHIDCNGVSLKEIENAFDHLRGKTIDNVLIQNVKGNRPSSLLFWNTRVRRIEFYNCDLKGISESDSKPAFIGVENSLKELAVWNVIKGVNQLKTLDLSHLKNLKHLYLANNNIPEVGNDWFAKGPLSLTDIVLFYCRVSKLGDNAFAHLANLKRLRFEGNSFSAFERSMLPNNAVHLESLQLNKNNLTRLQNDIFFGMPSLQVVELENNSIKRIEENTWNIVWEYIEKLYLEGNPLECDSHMDWMLSVKRPKKLFATCDSPASVKGERLLYLIEINRKFLSITGKSSAASSKEEQFIG